MKNYSYKLLPTFIIRSPLFPISFIKKKEIIQKELFKEALFLASPNLYDEIEKKSDQESKKIAHTLYKYFSRACTRSTPFGIFAGCWCMDLDELWNQSKDLSALAYTRLDMEYIYSIISFLESQPESKLKLRYHINDSIYKIGNAYRYTEYYSSPRKHRIIEVEATDYLEKIIQQSETNKEIHYLANTITDNEITYEEAKSFIEELIDSQILKSELEISVTINIDPLDAILATIKKRSIHLPINEKLIALQYTLKQINHTPIGKRIQSYKKIIQIAKEINIPFTLNNLIQTDLYKTNRIEVSPQIYKELETTVNYLQQQTTPYLSPLLEQFKNKFHQRYENQEIPLLKALDPDYGLTYYDEIITNEPLVYDILLNNSKVEIPLSLNSWEQKLLLKYIDAIKEGKNEIILENIDLSPHELAWENLPETFSVVCNIINNEKPEILIKHAGGTSAVNLIGRFCHLDKKILDYANRLIQIEEDWHQDKIVAEIVHLPSAHVANILLRPIFRKHEIHYLAQASAPTSIALSDLTISIKNNKIILKSKTFQKEVIPFLSTAHNFTYNSIPVYRFLCDLQSQYLKIDLNLYWGNLNQLFDYFPRIRYQNCILERQLWRIKKDEIKKWEKSNDSIHNAINKFCKEKNIPPKIVIIDGDNELFIDINEDICKEILIKQFNTSETTLIKEFLYEESTSPVRSKEGNYCNEFIFSFYKEKK